MEKRELEEEREKDGGDRKRERERFSVWFKFMKINNLILNKVLNISMGRIFIVIIEFLEIW